MLVRALPRQHYEVREKQHAATQHNDDATRPLSAHTHTHTSGNRMRRSMIQ